MPNDPALAPRILVVDDNTANREVARYVLEMEGCRVVAVSGGAQALAASGPFDAVLMDLQMPAMDGWEATLRLRLRERPGHRPPILALTAYATDEARHLCEAVGFDGILSKPFDMGAFRMIVERYRARRTLSLPVFNAEIKRSGLDAAVRRYGFFLERLILLVDEPWGAEFDNGMRAALETSAGLGLTVLHERCRVLTSVPGTLRDLALAGVRAEIVSAVRFLSAAREAVRFRGRDGRRA